MEKLDFKIGDIVRIRKDCLGKCYSSYDDWFTIFNVSPKGWFPSESPKSEEGLYSVVAIAPHGSYPETTLVFIRNIHTGNSFLMEEIALEKIEMSYDESQYLKTIKNMLKINLELQRTINELNLRIKTLEEEKLLIDTKKPDIDDILEAGQFICVDNKFGFLIEEGDELKVIYDTGGWDRLKDVKERVDGVMHASCFDEARWIWENEDTDSLFWRTN